MANLLNIIKEQTKQDTKENSKAKETKRSAS
jgi:hypothetical protein